MQPKLPELLRLTHVLLWGFLGRKAIGPPMRTLAHSSSATVRVLKWEPSYLPQGCLCYQDVHISLPSIQASRVERLHALEAARELGPTPRLALLASTFAQPVQVASRANISPSPRILAIDGNPPAIKKCLLCAYKNVCRCGQAQMT